MCWLPRFLSQEAKHMKFANVIAVLLLTFSLNAVNAQVPQDQSLTPPGQETKPGLTVPQDPKAQPEQNKDEEDEIIVIPGPKIGKPQKPQLTPAMFEMLYQAVWAKVGKEYQDPYKLNNWASWQNKYKGKLKTQEDLDAAIKDLLGSLNDRWTVYYGPSDLVAQEKAQKEGMLSIGMLVRKHSDDLWHIDNLSFNSPAMLSTLREGDVVKSVNGKALDKLTAGEVSKLLRGKAGEKLSVVTQYGGADHTVELTFAPQGPDEVALGMLPGNILYIRLPTFISEETVGMFAQALSQAWEEADGQINGLVFDLRYNSGGLVTMALSVSSLFLERGTVTATTTRQDRSVQETRYNVIPVPQYLEARMPKEAALFTHFLQTVPLVVLTNGSTASASEITTGALKDNGRAFVIGTHTFGKAVGYTRQALPNGGVLQVTNLSYLTPNGSNIADKGINPDKVIEQPRGQAIMGENDEQLKAAHEHLLKVAQVRAKQLAEAQRLATQGHGDVSADAKQPFVWQPLHILLATVGGSAVLLVVLFGASKLTRRKR